MIRIIRGLSRRLLPGLATLVALATLAVAGSAMAAPDLDGAWVVDLTTDPGKPYLKPMSLELKSDGTVSGSFYDSTILAGRWKASKGRLCASFRTTDGRGPYHSTACLTGDTVQGQTWAEHRNFVFLWTAARPTPRP